MKRPMKRLNGKLTTRARYVMSKYLGRELKIEEQVHHIDSNVYNDDISNLKLFTNRQEHLSYHLRQGDNKALWGGKGNKHIIPPNAKEAWCGKCKMFKLREEFYKSPCSWNGLHSYCKPCHNKDTIERR